MVQVEVRVVDLELVEVELRQVLETEPHFASSQLKIGTTAALQFLLELSLVTTNFNTTQFSALFVCAKYSIRYKCLLSLLCIFSTQHLPPMIRLQISSIWHWDSNQRKPSCRTSFNFLIKDNIFQVFKHYHSGKLKNPVCSSVPHRTVQLPPYTTSWMMLSVLCCCV